MNTSARTLRAITVAAALLLTAAVPLTASAAPPRCATSGLAVWVGIGLGQSAAGSTYYPIELTNVSGQTCRLFGFPGVSAHDGEQQVGSPARWDHSVPAAAVTLAPGATAHTVLQIVNVENFPAETCVPAAATSLEVYPPNQTTATSIPLGFSACSVEGKIFMNVQPIQPGVGVPGY